MIDGATALTRMPSLADLLGKRGGERGDCCLAGGVGGHAGAGSPFDAGAGGDVDDASALAGGLGRATAARQQSRQLIRFMSICCRSVATGFCPAVPRQNRRRHGSKPTAARCLVKPATGCLIGEAASDSEPDLPVVAQAETLRVGFVETRHVANRAGLDQGGDEGGAKRASATGDDNVTIAEIHGVVLLAARNGISAIAGRGKTLREGCPAVTEGGGFHYAARRGENQWPTSISRSSAAASTAPASPAMPPDAG